MDVFIGTFLVIALLVLLGRINAWLENGSQDKYKDCDGRVHRAPPVRRSVTKQPYLETTPFGAAGQRKTIKGRPYVTDGDSLIIKKTEIRLYGVDAPEMNHPFGNKAKWALFNLCKGQEVRAEVDHIDAYGRTVSKCYLSDGRDLSAEMVKLGLAIDWAKYSGGKYRPLEVADARKKMWLADARQKGRMHVWDQFDARQKRS